MKAALITVTCRQCGAAFRKRADRVGDEMCSRKCRTSESLKLRERECFVCGATFYPRLTQIEAGQGKTCSVICRSKAQIGRKWTDKQKAGLSKALMGRPGMKGARNPKYKGRWVSGGYVWRNINGRVIQEHRLIAELVLGRKLYPDEIIHHRNRDTIDNRIDNLELMTRAQHMDEHRAEFNRAPPMRGSSNPSAKLTEEDVISIRGASESHSELAERYGVTGTLVAMIRKRKVWKHI